MVGLDPVYKRLPSAIKNHRDMNDEFDAGAAVDAIFDFCRQAMHIVAPMVPAIKLNIAFFERILQAKRVDYCCHHSYIIGGCTIHAFCNA